MSLSSFALFRFVCIAITLPAMTASVAAEEHFLHRFERRQLTDVYYSEGAGYGDINRDGSADVVHGPYWFAGPEFVERHEVYAPRAQPRHAYADSFFSWVYDFDGDGWNDILAVGFPGTPAYVYQNPGQIGRENHWAKHEVLDWVSNESPQFTNLVGDAKPELVCTRDGRFGYALINWSRPLSTWQFHAISGQVAPPRFGHGLGVGDIDGDGRADVICKDGWFRQPASIENDSLWEFFAFPFAPRGGADMFAYDVDGDSDNDVITSLAAHEFGLAWYEHLRDGPRIAFKQHLIMGERREQNRYGVLFSELHAVALVDMDGDGLKDIVTGKTYWSHHTQSPMWDAGAVVYWFRLVRRDDEIGWVPYLADSESGIGRQLSVGDINGDLLPDIVVGGMKGAHVLTHIRQQVDADVWEEAQPKVTQGARTGSVSGRQAPTESDAARAQR